MDPVTAAVVGVGMGGAQAGLKVYEAQQQNKAIKRSIGGANNSATIQSVQVQRQGELRRQQRVAEMQKTIGALRVASAASGLGTGSSYGQMENSAAVSAKIDSTIIDENTAMNKQAIYAQNAARVAQLTSQMVDPIMAGLGGAIQGAQTGMSISGGNAALTGGGGMALGDGSPVKGFGNNGFVSDLSLAPGSGG